MDARREGPREPPEPGRRLGRAAFLGTVAAGIAGIAVAPTLSRIIGGLPSLGTGDGWRIYAVASPMPRFDPATYRLRIDGAVQTPLTLTWDEVAALPADSQVCDFHCVTGWSVADVGWRGIRSRRVLELANPAPEARYVTFLSLEEPYVDQLSIEQFALPDVMLATHMDGAPITREHGAPLRLVIPRMYGYKGVKWVSALRFDTKPGLGYWEARGYDVDAWVGDSNGL